jgi:hypothetical protein
MIGSDLLAYIEDNAYLPEHLIHYVTAVSQSEPFLIRDFLVYVRKERAIFVGYPLKETFDEKQIKKALKEISNQFKVKEINVISPAIPGEKAELRLGASDDYYRLNLSGLSIPQKLRNMLHRAEREVSVKIGRTYGEEHRQLVRAFMASHPVGEETRFIFERIPEYLSKGATAWVFEARDGKGSLIAFDIADFGSRHYAFYMFNFSSRDQYVPGASDLLLREVIKKADDQGKTYINLGLGISAGVSFFKKKWSAAPFLPYRFCLYPSGKSESMDALFQKL